MDKLGRIKTYLSLYQEYFKISLHFGLSFRLNFVLALFVAFLFVVSSVLTVKLLFLKFDHIGGWDEGTFLFFTCFVVLILELHNTFLTFNYWEFQNLILKGDLDFLLVKPISPLFSSFFKVIRINTLAILPIEALLLVYYGIKIDLSFISWLALPLLIILSLCLLTIIGILQSCLIFWLYQGAGVNYLRMHAQNIACWPDQIFIQPFRSLLTYMFPLLLIASAPVSFLLNPANFLPLILLILAIIVFGVITWKVWCIGLKHYESASS